MEIKLYNTLSLEKEIFRPIKAGEVGMYNCGPTVYHYAHLGNLRHFVFAALLRKVLEYNDYRVKQIINITDVGQLVSDGDDGEDKMTKALRREGKPLTMEAMKEVADLYFDEFKKDLQSLNIEMPAEFPKASEHIQEDIELIKSLESKGFAYRISDGMYFDTAKFPRYGKLGNIDIAKLREGARVESNSEKNNFTDFCLWKFNDKLGWESPWGKGFPGWHIECSAMSEKYLGQPFDIHTGGIDLIPTHHNNEIAQSEGAHDRPLANYWMHNAFLNSNDGKMSKSSGSFLTLRTLAEHSISALSYKYWLLTAHYRSPINFSLEALGASQTALIRLLKIVSELPEGGKISPSYEANFHTFVNDDLDTPKAIALMWDLVKDESVSDEDKRATILSFDRVFGLKLSEVPKAEKAIIPEAIKALAEAREEARKEKDWTKADALRAEVEERGYLLKDTEGGFEITEA